MIGDRAELTALVAETTTRGQALRCGDYLGVWEKGDHPYGQPSPCPFCKSPQEYTNLWYNGPGSPPSYAWQCDDCGAQGPTSSGKFKGDHYGAIIDALEKWNASALDRPASSQGDVDHVPDAGTMMEHAFKAGWDKCWCRDSNADCASDGGRQASWLSYSAALSITPASGGE